MPDVQDVGGLVPHREAPAATTAGKPRVLLVDDEPAVLAALQRQLRLNYTVESAEGGQEAIRIAAESDPFAVVMTDMRMPSMDGVAVLTHMRENYPDTVRILLTGYADLDSAIAAVNDGNVFRFLTKPSAPDIIRGAIDSAVGQHNLILAERELLEGTLQGSVRALLETLSLANPAAFSRATRVKSNVSRLLSYIPVEDRWEIEVAAMLSQVGAVALPPEVVEKLHHGHELDDEESAMVERMPAMADHLLKDIPRLEGVRNLIRQLPNWSEPAAPQGTKLIRMAIDYDMLEAQGKDPGSIVEELHQRATDYGSSTIEAMKQVAEASGAQRVVEIEVNKLKTGMVLAADLRTTDHMLLVSRGFAVTDSVLERIRNFARTTGLESSVVRVVAEAT
jgi:response regulator RpfG family c-di-GMP phosphodiesterase